ncbi:MAG: hypothetical protein R3F14_17275 [Polyangiaceae bacterium]
MQERYGQLAKNTEREPLGWLGRMTELPCLLEMIQSTPGPRTVRGNVRKQLTLDHTRILEAAKAKQPEPSLVHLWMLSAGRPRDVLDGYEYRPHEGWPCGFWTRSRLDATGIVVLSELPRRRDTLLLRLLGRGRVLQEAIADLKSLPEGAAERDIAQAPLVALRFEVTQDPHPDAEAREFLMETQDLYEQWEARTRAEGRTEGMQQGRTEGMRQGRRDGVIEGILVSLGSLYESRFGPMPAPVREALARKVTAENVGEWMGFVLSATSPEDIARRVLNGKAAT